MPVASACSRCRAWKAVRRLPGWLNQMLIVLHDVERNTLFPINRLGGVTAFCLAEKPAAAVKSDAAKEELLKAS